LIKSAARDERSLSLSEAATGFISLAMSRDLMGISNRGTFSFFLTPSPSQIRLPINFALFDTLVFRGRA
jgi:hypothetical protein